MHGVLQGASTVTSPLTRAALHVAPMQSVLGCLACSNSGMDTAGAPAPFAPAKQQHLKRGPYGHVSTSKH